MSPAVLRAKDVQFVLSSRSDQAILRGSPPEPRANKCRSLDTTVAILSTGALETAEAIVLGALGCQR